MKKHLLFGFLGIIALSTSCKKNNPIDNFFTFEVESKKTEVDSLPSLDTIVTFPAGGITLPMRYSSATESKKFFEDNHTSPNFINYVKLSQIYLSLLSPDSGNFDCMDYVRVYVKANTGDPILVATKNNIPKGTKYIATDPVDADLKSYFVQDTIYFIVEPHLISLPPKGGVIEMGANYKVSITATKI